MCVRKPIQISFLVLAMTYAGICAGQSLTPPITSSFGTRHDPINGERRQHRGVDFSAKLGAPVLAAASGTVTFAGRRGGYGLSVDISHPDGTSARYAHLSAVAVRYGERVSVSSVIGRVGATGRATGPHLHFEYRIADSAVDPLPYFSDMTKMAVRSQFRVKTAAYRSHYARTRCQDAYDRMAPSQSEGKLPMERSIGC